MNLVKTFENKAVCELLTLSKYFEKQHFHLLRDIRNLIELDKSLSNEFINTQYSDKYGRPKPTYLITKLGFFLLVSSFKGAKALQWKKDFYAEYERQQKELDKLQHENSLLREIGCTLNMPPKMDLSKNKILDELDKLQHDNYIKEKLINEYEQCTYCITDLCCKFEELDPVTANNYLRGKGIIEKRASGYYPTLEYLGINICISATCVGDNGFINYVRYTPKGLEYITNLLISDGYQLKEV